MGRLNRTQKAQRKGDVVSTLSTLFTLDPSDRAPSCLLLRQRIDQIRLSSPANARHPPAASACSASCALPLVWRAKTNPIPVAVHQELERFIAATASAP